MRTPPREGEAESYELSNQQRIERMHQEYHRSSPYQSYPPVELVEFARRIVTEAGIAIADGPVPENEDKFPLDLDPHEVGRITALHANVRLPGKVALVIDTGSPKNTAGSNWTLSAREAAQSAGVDFRYQLRDRPLDIEGVGHGVHTCINDVSVQGAVPLSDGTSAITMRYIAPVIPDSNVPGLLGLDSLRQMGAVLDCRNLQLHFVGEHTKETKAGMKFPEGTRTAQLELSESGHMMLPFSEYSKVITAAYRQNPSVVKMKREPFGSTEAPRDFNAAGVAATLATETPDAQSSSSSSRP